MIDKEVTIVLSFQVSISKHRHHIDTMWKRHHPWKRPLNSNPVNSLKTANRIPKTPSQTLLSCCQTWPGWKLPKELGWNLGTGFQKGFTYICAVFAGQLSNCWVNNMGWLSFGIRLGWTVGNLPFRRYVYLYIFVYNIYNIHIHIWSTLALKV